MNIFIVKFIWKHIFEYKKTYCDSLLKICVVPEKAKQKVNNPDYLLEKVKFWVKIAK